MENISVTLGKRQLVDSIWKSAGIEGLGTTFPNTERILHNLPVETKREEVTFIVNMKRAWEYNPRLIMKMAKTPQQAWKKPAHCGVIIIFVWFV